MTPGAERVKSPQIESVRELRIFKVRWRIAAPGTHPFLPIDVGLSRYAARRNIGANAIIVYLEDAECGQVPFTSTSMCVPDIVSRIGCSHRDSVALSAGNTRMTYRELIARADRLAGRMMVSGVQRGVPVGICLERSFDYVVAVLAAMRAGAAWLPLDPEWPQARLRFMLEDAGAPIVVTSPDRRDLLATPGRTVLLANSLRGPQEDTTLRDPKSAALEDLAYIIYTSGSTGEPKGTEITHGNLVNLLTWHQKAFGVTRTARASFMAGLGFDAAVWEIWPYLAAGACVLPVDETARHSSDALHAWLIDRRITHAFVPTPLAEQLMAMPWPADTALRFLLTGGDTLRQRPVQGLPFSVVNNYGPSECTVVATSGIVTPSAGADDLPAIGRPISGVDIHILDEAGEPVSNGGIGEIHIGGAGVGGGYRNRRALTAERFVPDRFRPTGCGARLYRTGDLGRWLADGQIAFHGRCDEQVKIRGNRVEPEEIAAVLLRHSLVAQGATLLRHDGREPQLVAYIVPKAEDAPDAGDLRRFLSSSLPEYMLPSAFVVLAALPLTPSGKLDRAALPAPSRENMLADAQYREPTTTIESTLVAIASGLLGCERIGVEDNFFLLGGHSLLGTQLVQRARQALDVDLTLRDLFQAQTIARLAARIEHRIVERLEQMDEDEAAEALAG